MVYTRLFYSGNGDYWSVHPDKKCDFVDAELYIPQSLIIEEEYLKLLKNIRVNYQNRYLIIDAIGVYQKVKDSKFRRFEHNKASFLVDQIINIQEVVTPKNTKPSSR